MILFNLIVFLLKLVILICFIISLVILYFPLSVYELVSQSYTYNAIADVEKEFNNSNPIMITLFLSNGNIYKSQGNIKFDLYNNTISFNVSGNTYTFDLDTDINKFIAMYILSN